MLASVVRWICLCLCFVDFVGLVLCFSADCLRFWVCLLRFSYVWLLLDGFVVIAVLVVLVFVLAGCLGCLVAFALCVCADSWIWWFACWFGDFG